ncbi:MAG: hypothetical protein IH852_07340 [Bacteroidetes bacterium]|nr:hypothetical protein [Bacteroidota bacterium]
MLSKTDARAYNRFYDRIDELISNDKITYRLGLEIISILSWVLHTKKYANPEKIISCEAYRDRMDSRSEFQLRGDEIDFDTKEFINSLCKSISIQILKIDCYIREASKLKSHNTQNKFLTLVIERLNNSESGLMEVSEILTEFLDSQTDMDVEMLLSRYVKECDDN